MKFNNIQFLLNNVTDGVIIVNKDDEIIDLNKSTEDIFKIHKEDILGKNLDYVLVDYKQFKNLNNNINVHGKNINIETVKINNEEENILTVILLKNSTELKNLKDELYKEKDSRKILKNILDMSYDGIVVVDENGCISAISKAYADFLQIDDEKAIGKPVEEVIENTRMHIVVKTGKESEADLQLIKGKYMIASRKLIKIDGKIRGAVGKVLFRNLNELKYFYKKFNKIQKELQEYKGEIQKLNSANYSFGDIIGNSENIMETKNIAEKSAKTSSNVLLIGESGTGKELFAHSIHKNSSRKYGPFVKINCGAIPSDLLESELFGYDTGAFTGAKKEGKMGKFELADGGTIFLDEIGDMPLHMQVKLLRVLQEKEVERIGSMSPKEVDIRIIAATNRNLGDMVSQGKFRSDLYYRLNVVTIKVPALRHRKEDIEILANFLCRKICVRLGKKPCKISNRVLQYFKNYKWEGNIRQLENVIERALNIIENENVILPKHIPSEITGVKDYEKIRKLEDVLNETEKDCIIKAINICSGNKLKAANILGIGRTTLYEKINKHKIF